VLKRVGRALVLNWHLFTNYNGVMGMSVPDHSQGGGRERRRGQRPAGRLQTRARSERAPVRQQQLRIRGLSLRGKNLARGSVVVKRIYMESDSHIGDHPPSASKRGFTQEPPHT